MRVVHAKVELKQALIGEGYRLESAIGRQVYSDDGRGYVGLSRASVALSEQEVTALVAASRASRAHLLSL